MENKTITHVEQLAKNQRGMTLIEILAVITLLTLIFLVVGKGVMGKSDAAKAKLNMVKIEKVKNALSQYRLDFNTYPESLNGLIKPSAKIAESGKLFVAFVEQDDLNDVWGYPFEYKLENDGRSYVISTLGSDGLPGGEGAKQDVSVRP